MERIERIECNGIWDSNREGEVWRSWEAKKFCTGEFEASACKRACRKVRVVCFAVKDDTLHFQCRRCCLIVVFCIVFLVESCLLPPLSSLAHLVTRGILQNYYTGEAGLGAMSCPSWRLSDFHLFRLSSWSCHVMSCFHLIPSVSMSDLSLSNLSTHQPAWTINKDELNVDQPDCFSQYWMHSLGFALSESQTVAKRQTRKHRKYRIGKCWTWRHHSCTVTRLWNQRTCFEIRGASWCSKHRVKANNPLRRRQM